MHIVIFFIVIFQEPCCHSLSFLSVLLELMRRGFLRCGILSRLVFIGHFCDSVQEIAEITEP